MYLHGNHLKFIHFFSSYVKNYIHVFRTAYDTNIFQASMVIGSDRCSPTITSSVHGPPLRKGKREVFSYLREILGKKIPPFPFLKEGPCTEEVMEGEHLSER